MESGINRTITVQNKIMGMNDYEKTKYLFIFDHCCIVYDINRPGWGESPLGLFGS
jgi:hypothetical protein